MARVIERDRAAGDASGRPVDPTIPAGIGQFAIIQSVAPSIGVELTPIDVRDVEQDLTAFVRSGEGGIITTSSALALVHRDLIAALAARHRLPTVYHFRGFVAAGGLISWSRQYRPAPTRCQLR